MTPRVLLLNNYSMRSALRRVELGDYPEQHLYGFPPDSRGRSGMEWELPRRSLYEGRMFRSRFGRKFRSAVLRSIGDPLQQVDALRAGRVDIVFAADQWSARLLLALRAIRWLNLPVVVLVHHRPRGLIQRRLLRAADGLCFFDSRVMEDFVGDASLPRAVLPWGPEIESEVYNSALARPAGESIDFVAAGKTNRDYIALHRAASEGKLSGVIYDGVFRTEYVKGRANRTRVNATYPDILSDMVRAAAVVIPIRDASVMAGLTEVADAIALNKPIISTRSHAFPYHLEERRAGITIPAGSSQALLSAIEQLRRGEIRGAGTLGEKYNAASYRASLDEMLQTALSRSRHRIRRER